MRASTGGNDVLSYFFKCIACLAVILGIFGLVWLRSGIIRVEYELGSLERELGGVLRERKDLVAERASMFSVCKVADGAQQRLGLEFPDRSKVFYVTRDKGEIPVEAAYNK